MAEGGEKGLAGQSDIGGYDSESADNEGIGPQDEAAAAAKAAGIDMSGYDFGLAGSQDDDEAYANALQSVQQATFNSVNQITAENPYGRQGLFTRVFGIDPKNISYANIMSPSQRIAIANNQFSKFSNPRNVPGQLGYNPDFPTAPPGELRPGVQSSGYSTAYGDVMGQYAAQSPSEMAARGLMGLLGGPVGMFAGQLGTQEYGIPGMPGFESFDPNNPRGPQSVLGNIASAFTGGVDPTQATAAAAAMGQDISDFFSPEAPAPTPAAQEQGLNQSLDSFEDTKAARSNAGISGVLDTIRTNLGIQDGLTGFQTTTTPTGFNSVQTIGDMTQAEAQAIQDRLEAAKNMTTSEAAQSALGSLMSEIAQ